MSSRLLIMGLTIFSLLLFAEATVVAELLNESGDIALFAGKTAEDKATSEGNVVRKTKPVTKAEMEEEWAAEQEQEKKAVRK